MIPGCAKPTEGYVHVDNGSEQLIVVFVDDKQQARIGPGRCRRLKLPLGQRHFIVKCGDEVIYEETHTLDAGKNSFRSPTYVLNPDRSNRYCDVEVVYHDDAFGGQDLADLITMISNPNPSGSTDQDAAPEETSSGGEGEEESKADAETEQQRRRKNRALVRQYRRVSKQLVAKGDEAFFEIHHSGDLFKPLPTVVYSRQSGDQKRTTLARIPKVLHDYIAEAARVKQPTAEQLERLKVAHEVAISYVPFR